MKKIAFSLVCLVGFSSFAFAEEYDAMLNRFYASIGQGCIDSSNKSKVMIDACNCTAASFKKKFTKAEEADLIKFFKSLASKPANKRQELINAYQSSAPMKKKMSDSMDECVRLILQSK